MWWRESGAALESEPPACGLPTSGGNDNETRSLIGRVRR